MLKAILFVALLHNLQVVLALENLCPPPEEVSPCYCVSDGITTRLDCMAVTSPDDVRKALLSLKGIKDIYVDFIRARMDRVPSDLFKGLHITKISFTNCDLKSIGDPGRSALEGLEDIIEEFSVHFSFNEENEFKYLNLSSLRVIEDIEIEGNELKRLGNEWFKDGPVSVQNLYIMTNYIEELGDRAFENLVNLKSLYFTENKIKELKRSMLPSPAIYLRTLELTDNGITSLPNDMFTNMPALKEVILTDNKITSLPEATWFNIWTQLRGLYLDSNPLECHNIEWMFKVKKPLLLKGECTAPIEYKNRQLKIVIDENRKDDDDE